MVYRGTANGLLDLGVGIGKHWTAIMERLQGALNEGNEVMATSPSNEPLLNGAVNESEASLLPSYSVSLISNQSLHNSNTYFPY